MEYLFNRRYETFGLLGQPAEGLPGLGDVEDIRFLGVAPPRAIFATVAFRF